MGTGDVVSNCASPATTVLIKYYFSGYFARSPSSSFPQPPRSRYLQVLLSEMSTSLDQLKATGTVVVSDSGDFESKPVSRFHRITNRQPIPTISFPIFTAIDIYKPQVREFTPSIHDANLDIVIVRMLLLTHPSSSPLLENPDMLG